MEMSQSRFASFDPMFFYLGFFMAFERITKSNRFYTADFPRRTSVGDAETTSYEYTETPTMPYHVNTKYSLNKDWTKPSDQLQIYALQHIG